MSKHDLSELLKLQGQVTESSGRTGSMLSVDQNFVNESRKALSNIDITNTLVIVNTGHSIPIGLLFVEQGYSLAWYQDVSKFEKPCLDRLRDQLKSYPLTEQKSSGVDSIPNVILLDVHEPISTENFPSSEQLYNAGIRKIVEIAEMPPGKYEVYKGDLLGAFYTECESKGISTQRFGVDNRNRGTTYSTQAMSGFSNRQLIYRDSKVERLGDDFFAQSKDGKRYIFNNGEYYKIVNDFRKVMIEAELEEFSKAIEEFKGNEKSSSDRVKPPKPK